MVKNIIILVLLLCIIGLVVYLVWQRKRQEREINKLIQYLTLVQDRLDLPELASMKEGQFSILQSEIYKVVNLLKESYSAEKRQHRYTVDLMSDISHQIKTPVTAITILADLLEAPDVTEEQRMEYAGKIDMQVSKITWLVRNLLTLSQLEADMLPLHMDEMKADSFCEQVVEPLQIMAEVKGVNVCVNVDSNTTFFCDKHWMVEAIQNIVKNAIEHSKTDGEGQVWLTVTQDHLATRIQVKDNGEGIEKHEIPHIFERFYKSKNADSSSVGIGLSMANQIVLKQNGCIDVKSKKGEGTVMDVKLYRQTSI